MTLSNEFLFSFILQLFLFEQILLHSLKHIVTFFTGKFFSSFNSLGKNSIMLLINTTKHRNNYSDCNTSDGVCVYGCIVHNGSSSLADIPGSTDPAGQIHLK